MPVLQRNKQHLAGLQHRFLRSRSWSPLPFVPRHTLYHGLGIGKGWMLLQVRLLDVDAAGVAQQRLLVRRQLLRLGRRI